MSVNENLSRAWEDLCQTVNSLNKELAPILDNIPYTGFTPSSYAKGFPVDQNIGFSKNTIENRKRDVKRAKLSRMYHEARLAWYEAIAAEYPEATVKWNSYSCTVYTVVEVGAPTFTFHGLPHYGRQKKKEKEE